MFKGNYFGGGDDSLLLSQVTAFLDYSIATSPYSGQRTSSECEALPPSYLQVFGRTLALDGATIEVYLGQLTGFLGQSGSGISTMFNIFAGKGDSSLNVNCT